MIIQLTSSKKMNKIIYLIFLFLILISFNCEGQARGMPIKRKNFIRKVSCLNNKIATRDTSSILTFDCVEIIRIENTLRMYGYKVWIKTKRDSVILYSFQSEIESTDNFYKILSYYMHRKLGEVEVTSGFGVRYIEFDIYSGGRIINDNSFYRKKKVFFN